MARPSRIGRVLRWTGLALSILVLAVVAVVAWTLATFNPDSLKPRLEAEVHALTGRTLALNGPIRLHLSLHPALEVSDVALSNPPGFSRPEMARLGKLSLGLDALALLHGQIAISRLTLDRPDILLERAKSGAVNWRFAPAAAKSAPTAGATSTPTAAPGGGMSLFVGAVRLVDATLGYRDDATGKATILHLPSLTLSEASPTAPLVLTATGALGAAPGAVPGAVPVAVHVTTGSLTVLMGDAAVPLRARLAAAGADLTLDGRIAHPLAGSGLALDVTAAVPSLRAVGQLAGMSLPAIRVGLRAKLALPGTVAQGGRISGLSLTLPGGTVTGDLALRLASVPTVSGVLSSATFDADTLLAALRGTPAAAPAHPAQAVATSGATSGATAGAPAAAGGYVIPTTPLPLGALRTVDTDLRVSIGALTAGGQVWRNLSLPVRLQAGRLSLAPFAVTTPSGPVGGDFAIDAAAARPPVSLRLHAPAVALAALLKLAGEKGLASGTMAIDLDLHGAGASPHAIAASLTGTVVATMQGGSIDNAVVNRMFGPMLARANLAGLLAHGGQSQIECVAARLTAANGAARLAPFLFASTLNTVDGGGTLNLGAETLDLTFRPQARAGGTGVAVPVHVGGRFAAPSYGLAQGAIAQAGIGAALSFLSGQKLAVPAGLQASRPSCAAALASARTGAPLPAAVAPKPAAPAPTQAKPGTINPGAILKQLFH